MEFDPTAARPASIDQPYADALPQRKPAGAILIDNVQVADTLRCVHCGGHWVPRAGSGITRGWCMRCNGPVCGRTCAKCVPFEQRMDQVELIARRELMKLG